MNIFSSKIPPFKIFPLILLCANFIQARISSLRDVVIMVNDPKRTITNFSRVSPPIEFILDCYMSDPEGCLKIVLNLKCIPIERLFFSVILSEFIRFDVPLPSNPINTFENIFMICDRIRIIVACLFYQPFYSEEEMNRRFVIIRLYIRFAKKYIEYPDVSSSLENYGGKIQILSLHIKAWRFAINYLPIISPNGKIDYLQFFSFFHKHIRSCSSSFPEYNEKYAEYYFLFATLLNQMCEKKDLDLFIVDHPDLPFLVGLLIENISNFGRNLLAKNFYSITYYQYLNRFFRRDTKFESLASTLRHEKDMIASAKKELGLDESLPYSNPLLIDSLERVPLVCQSKGYHNILWQLKAYTLIKQFLIASGYHKLIQKLL
jgi:hypothetical protein